MDEDSKNLSKKLFHTLEEVGASENSRHFYRHAAIIANELCNRYVFTENIKMNICGGFFEGSFTPDIAGDTDVVLSLEATPVVFDTCMNERIPGISYLAEQSDYPGYVKLKLLKDGNVATKYDIDERNHHSFEITDDRTMYLKHQHATKDFNIFQSASINGPAQALTSGSGEHLFDVVLALKSLSIPPFADEWLTRFRPSGWPSSEQLDQMSKMGCLFVGVGHPDSADEETLWRISFVLQERDLMSSLNAVQHKVYVLLKILKKELIEQQISDSISSYNCKTCLLNCVENTPACLWEEKNLVACLLMCLRYLYDHVEKKTCPNFFVIEQNLFERDRIRNNKDKILELDLFTKVLANNCEFLYNLKSDNIYAMLIGHADVDRYQRDRKLRMLFNHKQGFIGFTVVVRDLLLFQIRPYSHRRLHGLLLHLLHPKPGTHQHLIDANSHFVPWLEVRVGLSLASKALSQKDHPAFTSVRETALEHIQRGSKYDLMYSRLAKSTVLLQLERYQECTCLLQELESHVTDLTISACFCDICRRIPGLPSSFELHYQTCVAEVWGNKAIKEINTNMIACCFAFLPCDEHLIPKPLLYEIEICKAERAETLYDFFRGWVTVDAKIYMYTLFYLVGEATENSQLKKWAIRQITHVLDYDRNQGHKHVTYNILGWIMIQEGAYLAAVEYFLKSWNMRPGQNAAKFHIRELVRRVDDKEPAIVRYLLQFISSAVHLL